MADSPQTLSRTLWLGFGAALVMLCLAIGLAFSQKLQQRNVPLPVIGQIADFTLTNQDAQVVTLADLTNHVWIADIIFTRCPGPCPRMTMQMKSVQDSLPASEGTKLVTLTTDPDYDTPELLKRYGQHFDASFSNWNFLTGSKEQIASLAAGSLKLGSTPVDPQNRTNVTDLFIHTTIFVAVDKHAQLRGVFETGGEDVDWTNVVEPQLLRAVHRLNNEP